MGVQHPLCSSDVRHQNSSLMGRSSRWCSRSGNVLDVMRSSPPPSHCTISPTSSGGAIGTTTSLFLGPSPISTAPRTCTGPAASCPPCASGRSYPWSSWPPSRPNTSLTWPQRQAAGALVPHRTRVRPLSPRPSLRICIFSTPAAKDSGSQIHDKASH